SEEKSSNKFFKNSSIASNNSEKEASKATENQKNNLIGRDPSKNALNEGIVSSKNNSEKTDIGKNDKEEKLINKDKIFDAKKEAVVLNESPDKLTSEKNLVNTEKEITEESKNKKSIFDAIAEKDE